jgi:hypothetical protein
LNADDRLGLPKSLGKPLVLTPQPIQFLLLLLVRLGFAPALFRRQPCLTLPSPIGQVRGVKAFAP